MEWENNNISWTSQELERIRGGKQFFLSSAPFRPFSALKIIRNSAADLSYRSTFYSALFDLCGRTIDLRRNILKKLLGENWYNKIGECFYKTVIYSELSFAHTGSNKDGGAPRQACCGGPNWLRKGKSCDSNVITAGSDLVYLMNMWLLWRLYRIQKSFGKPGKSVLELEERSWMLTKCFKKPDVCNFSELSGYSQI